MWGRISDTCRLEKAPSDHLEVWHSMVRCGELQSEWTNGPGARWALWVGAWAGAGEEGVGGLERDPFKVSGDIRAKTRTPTVSDSRDFPHDICNVYSLEVIGLIYPLFPSLTLLHFTSLSNYVIKKSRTSRCSIHFPNVLPRKEWFPVRTSPISFLNKHSEITYYALPIIIFLFISLKKLIVHLILRKCIISIALSARSPVWISSMILNK